MRVGADAGLRLRTPWQPERALPRPSHPQRLSRHNHLLVRRGKPVLPPRDLALVLADQPRRHRRWPAIHVATL